ncbi:unnamed protein product [Pleuronectes platessa]|uniref:Uncharacterized protein n=1 Tax=Pleuronectes platessa TaxID=8262 RepID=A0A9N7Y5Q1_PLEPL|nr:unnamed protein product [Pleuronectes platessa]
MKLNIPKDNPNMTCQAVPLQSQSIVSNQQDHDPPSRPERHSSPQSPSIATHHEPPPRSWSNARTRCQCDTGSATTTTISPHDTESAAPPWICGTRAAAFWTCCRVFNDLMLEPDNNELQ